ncbi:hypothetical protein BpHYR1_025153 [Brachionus plicatilis]|uniref:Uncharacterized protein n=1 Tax=Brachionus plicatilis TaxID=10195 RepID=A0A3M7RTY3_BRAPC|nr:hypothetical protein BpHYR1_025153 [Brachionus plicatilis]
MLGNYLIVCHSCGLILPNARLGPTRNSAKSAEHFKISNDLLIENYMNFNLNVYLSNNLDT